MKKEELEKTVIETKNKLSRFEVELSYIKKMLWFIIVGMGGQYGIRFL